MVGSNHFRRADEQLAMVLLQYQFPQPILDTPPEMVGIERIEAAIHKAIAVRRSDYGVAIRVENRAGLHRHALEVAAKFIPSVHQALLRRAKYDFHLAPQ